MAVGEGGADGADHIALPGLVGYYHVHVAFYDHHLPGALDMRAGRVEAVEDGASVEAGGRGRVEVLWCLAIAGGATAEAHPRTLGIADREEEAVAEPIVVPARIALGP